MGTTFRLSFYAISSEQAKLAGFLAFERVHQLDQVFSDYNPQSEASLLASKAGEKVRVSDDLWHIIRISKQLSKDSHGAFDITVGPLTKLWRRAIRQHMFPDTNNIRQAQKLVNYRWIRLFPKSQQVKLKKEGMKLDFGGIAKGYAIDQAYQVLVSQGISHILIDGGGDLYVDKNPPPGDIWNIKDHQGNTIIFNPPAAIASSGDSYKKLIWNGTRYSHIVDPDNGIGLPDSEVYTVIAESATIADALATTVGMISEKHKKILLTRYRARLVK